MKNLRITEKEAIAILNLIIGSPIMSVVQRTEPKLLKKDRVTKEPAMYETGEIAKLSELTVKVGSEYVTRVQNQLARENKGSDEYQSGINTNPIVKLAKNGILGVSEKNDRVMFEYGTLKNVKPIVRYLFGKNLIGKDLIGDILPAKSKATNQGTNVEVQIRKVYFSNILEFAVNQKRYVIVR